LWTNKLWPYDELEMGDTLYWYESPSKCIVWKSRVVDVLRFPYKHKQEVKEKLNLTPAEATQSYFVQGPDSGYCLHYKVEAVEQLRLPRPDGFRFPHQGWLKVGPEIEAQWPGLSSGAWSWSFSGPASEACEGQAPFPGWTREIRA